MSKYEQLDKEILSMLSNKPTPIWDIWLKWRYEGLDITVVDRRMQYLKKKSLVANIRGKGWVKL